MASDPERRADAPDGYGGLPQKGLVDLRGGAYLESCDLFPGRAAAEGLPRLRRESLPGAAGTIPGNTGGDGIRLD